MMGSVPMMHPKLADADLSFPGVRKTTHLGHLLGSPRCTSSNEAHLVSLAMQQQPSSLLPAPVPRQCGEQANA